MVFVVMLILVAVPAKPAAAASFTDVPANSWAVPAIDSAVRNGLVSGIGDGRFGYGEVITRAQFVALLSNMFGWGAAEAGESFSIPDVATGQWYYNHVQWAAQRGVIGSGAFDPGAPILRGDMAVMLVRALGYGTLAQQVETFATMPFTDVASDRGYIMVASDIGMINGIGNNLFAPRNTATREQAAAMITNVHSRLRTPLWVHGFYAFASFHQRELIRDMHAVSFGWARMEWDADGGARLNTTSTDGNHWVIPSGYEMIVDFLRENNSTMHLNIFMDTGMGLDNLLAHETSRLQAVDAIVYEATRTYDGIGRSPFDGVTINFEGLRGSAARANFSEFLVALEYQLRANGRALYVTVHPPTIDGVYFDGYDFRAIGRLADRVILMAHDYHPRSLEGFVGTPWHRNAALTPIAEVYRALTAIVDPRTGVEDVSKIALAFNFANIGWFIDEDGNATSPSPVVPSQETVLGRRGQPDTYFGWSDTFRNPFMIYTTEEAERVFLWYENARSVAEKLQLARLFGITGASVWRIGIVPNAPGWDVWSEFRRQN